MGNDYLRYTVRLFFLSILVYSNSVNSNAQVKISGEYKKWHTLTFTLDGPSTGETATPNPFLDYRVNITFTKGSKKYTVPGYYATDGNAANSSAKSGNKWRVNFTPDEQGTWYYIISFEQGTELAVKSISTHGTVFPALNGIKGNFYAGKSDKAAPDLRARGRLVYNEQDIRSGLKQNNRL